MDNADWNKNFTTMLEAYHLTLDDVRQALPRVLPSLYPDEVAALHGADFDHPQRMNDDQARILCLLMVRAAALLGTEWAEREHAQASSRN